MIQLPTKPWNEGDTFTNDTTGVEYTFDGVKWLASGGEELDITELDDRYVGKLGGDSMQGPLSITAQPDTGSRESRRINTLGVFSNNDGSALRLGTTRDRVYVGHDDTSFNGPIKVAEIQEKTADEGILLSNHTALADEGAEPNHLVTKGYVDGSIAAIEFPEADLTGYAKEEWVTEQIDDCVKQSDSWDMSLGTTLGVNQLKPLDGGTPFVYYEPTDYNSTHPCGIVNRGMMQNYVGDAIDGIELPEADLTGYAKEEWVTEQIDGIEFPETDLSGYVSKSGDEMTGQLTIKKSTQVALDIVGDGNESQIKFWSSGAVALQKYTAFKDNELVTKKYVDDKVGSGGGSSFTPGDQVAKTNGQSTNVGGFWVSNGALYCKVN